VVPINCDNKVMSNFLGNEAHYNEKLLLHNSY
jgi:hypothetical protein